MSESNVFGNVEEGLDCYLAEVFQYDRNVHVDDDEERDDEVRDKKQYRHSSVAAVAVRFHLGGRTVTFRRADHHAG